MTLVVLHLSWAGSLSQISLPRSVLSMDLRHFDARRNSLNGGDSRSFVMALFVGGPAEDIYRLLMYVESKNYRNITFQDELYVNVANPLVRAEVLHIKEVTKPTAGLLERFLNIAKEDMHTRSSFEQKYKLNWVEPLKK